MNNTTPDAPTVCSWSPAGNAFPLCKTAAAQELCYHWLWAFIPVEGPECCQMKMNAVTSKFSVCVYSKQFFKCWLGRGSICLWLVTPRYFVEGLCNLKENLDLKANYNFLLALLFLRLYAVFLFLLIPWFPQSREHEAVLFYWIGSWCIHFKMI